MTEVGAVASPGDVRRRNLHCERGRRRWCSSLAADPGHPGEARQAELSRRGRVQRSGSAGLRPGAPAEVRRDGMAGGRGRLAVVEVAETGPLYPSARPYGLD
jgi:hypothetical protein